MNEFCEDRYTAGVQKMIALGFKELLCTEKREFVLDFLEQLKTKIKKHYDSDRDIN